MPSQQLLQPPVQYHARHIGGRLLNLHKHEILAAYG